MLCVSMTEIPLRVVEKAKLTPNIFLSRGMSKIAKGNARNVPESQADQPADIGGSGWTGFGRKRSAVTAKGQNEMIKAWVGRWLSTVGS